MITRKPSPRAADELLDLIQEGLTPFDYETPEWEGATDCPEGCVVEPDGWCVHGWLSATETLLRTVA